MASWHEANQQYLLAAIGQVQHQLAQACDPPADVATFSRTSEVTFPEGEAAIETLCRRFKLSTFERALLLLCTGMELSRTLADLCAQLQQGAQHPTLGLALSLLPEAHWSALLPESPLRYWKLIELQPGAELTQCPLRIDERILHYLMGMTSLDDRLRGIMTASGTASLILPESHQQMAQQVMLTGLQDTAGPVVQLCGEDSATKLEIATAAAHSLNLDLRIIAAETLPTELSQMKLLQCLCEREALLSGAVLGLNCDRIPSTITGDGYFAQLNLMVDRLIETCRQPLLILSRDRRPQQQRPLLTYDIYPPTADEQRQLWHSTLGETAVHLNGHIDRLVSYFNLSAPTIQATCAKVQRLHSPSPTPPLPHSPTLPKLLWDTCLSQARPRLGDLAQRIETFATWDDLILPEKEKQVLQTLTAHVRQRSKVYEEWGFSGRSRRGLGISALFAGQSGTGKTMAAEIIAKELHLDLYRIDLSSVVSKYIGETEKNLRRVFDAAETGGAILLFDEADALFGKRSDVSDSHDRYANMEVAYLLQRIEAYRGLAILTTNLKDSVDQAFLRRIRFVIQFPFPDAKQREDIWQRIFPSKTPTKDLHYRRLAKLSVAGGNIRNIALNAAFLAADEDTPIEMKHILLAAQSEYIKLERPLTDSEVKGWVAIEQT
ncbi:ATP-binding protein [Leptothoe spongobia]|uniref:ATP-binding protein n=1 Tax=Leptothoe spongobia TAU-MAC 1115 TaxID=1967444 RepID=A0A947DHB9_9CYAN|nr:ATP-binding protein [Leptothoe spongobia]MBT9316653.1 ATP-binding protein [Leptothoe spongobia TAU-MAC 1115]